MALPTLATIADLESRGVTVDPAEETAVAVFLETASAIIRDAAGSPISRTTGTITLAGTEGTRLHLPAGPVTVVSSVELDGSAVTDYRLTNGALWRSCGWQTGCEPSEVAVTYTHGYDPVPADVVDLTCRLTARQLVALRDSGDGTGLADRVLMQERIGDYSVMFANGSTDQSFSDVELPAYMRARLFARFGPGPAVVVRSV